MPRERNSVKLVGVRQTGRTTADTYVDWAIDQALSRGMRAIVDMHHYGELTDQPEAHAARFVALWRQISAGSA